MLTMECPSRQEMMTKGAYESLPDGKWVEEIQAGSYPAFEALFHAYYEKLVVFAKGYVRKPEVAEELVQEVFFNIWKGRQNWRPRGTLKAYLFGAARNNSFKYIRRQRTFNRIQVQLQHWVTKNGDSSDQAIEYEEFDQAVRRAIDALPEKRRRIFILSRQQELSYAEIAAVLNISVNTVENQMVRALKFLRNHLSEFLPVKA